MNGELIGKSVYVSGAITSDPNFKAKFEMWSERLRKAGADRVINPANLLPHSDHRHTYEEYIMTDLQFVERCQVVFMLPCWKESPGARAEHALAECLKKEIIYA